MSKAAETAAALQRLRAEQKKYLQKFEILTQHADSVDSKNVELEGQVEALRVSEKRARQQLLSSENEVTSLRNKVEALEEEGRCLKEASATQKSELKSHRSLEEKIQKLEAQAKVSDAREQDLSDALAAARGQLDSFRQKMQAANRAQDKAKSSVAKAEASSQAEVDFLKKRVAQLEEEVGESGELVRRLSMEASSASFHGRESLGSVAGGPDTETWISGENLGALLDEEKQNKSDKEDDDDDDPSWKDLLAIVGEAMSEQKALQASLSAWLDDKKGPSRASGMAGSQRTPSPLRPPPIQVPSSDLRAASQQDLKLTVLSDPSSANTAAGEEAAAPDEYQYRAATPRRKGMWELQQLRQFRAKAERQEKREEATADEYQYRAATPRRKGMWELQQLRQFRAQAERQVKREEATADEYQYRAATPRRKGDWELKRILSNKNKKLGEGSDADDAPPVFTHLSPAAAKNVTKPSFRSLTAPPAREENYNPEDEYRHKELMRILTEKRNATPTPSPDSSPNASTDAKHQTSLPFSSAAEPGRFSSAAEPKAQPPQRMLRERSISAGSLSEYAEQAAAANSRANAQANRSPNAKAYTANQRKQEQGQGDSGAGAGAEAAGASSDAYQFRPPTPRRKAGWQLERLRNMKAIAGFMLSTLSPSSPLTDSSSSSSSSSSAAANGSEGGEPADVASWQDSGPPVGSFFEQLLQMEKSGLTGVGGEGGDGGAGGGGYTLDAAKLGELSTVLGAGRVMAQTVLELQDQLHDMQRRLDAHENRAAMGGGAYHDNRAPYQGSHEKGEKKSDDDVGPVVAPDNYQYRAATPRRKGMWELQRIRQQKPLLPVSGGLPSPAAGQQQQEQVGILIEDLTAPDKYLHRATTPRRRGAWELRQLRKVMQRHRQIEDEASADQYQYRAATPRRKGMWELQQLRQFREVEGDAMDEDFYLGDAAHRPAPDEYQYRAATPRRKGTWELQQLRQFRAQAERQEKREEATADEYQYRAATPRRKGMWELQQLRQFRAEAESGGMQGTGSVDSLNSFVLEKGAMEVQGEPAVSAPDSYLYRAPTPRRKGQWELERVMAAAREKAKQQKKQKQQQQQQQQHPSHSSFSFDTRDIVGNGGEGRQESSRQGGARPAGLSISTAGGEGEEEEAAAPDEYQYRAATPRRKGEWELSKILDAKKTLTPLTLGDAGAGAGAGEAPEEEDTTPRSPTTGQPQPRASPFRSPRMSLGSPMASIMESPKTSPNSKSRKLTAGTSPAEPSSRSKVSSHDEQ